MITNREFGAMVFNAIRTGVPSLPYVHQRVVREHDITDETMLLQRRERIRRQKQVAQHNNGWPIVNQYARRVA